MKRYSITLFLIALTLFLKCKAFAQEDLLAALNDLSGQLKHVKTADNEWKQALRANGLRPYQIFYEVRTMDKKGDSLTRVYDLNLADIDPESIKYEAKKNEMHVKMKTFRNFGFIKEKAGDQQISYQNELTLYANDIDNARALAEILRKSLPLAKKLMESSVKIGDNYQFLTDWLSVNVISIQGAAGLKQGLTYAPGFKDLKFQLIQQPEEKGKVQEEIFDLNLADIDEAQIGMGVSGKWVYLEMPTRDKRAYIKYIKNGKRQNNEKSVRLYFDDIEKARQGKMILEKLLPKSIPIIDGLKPAYSSLSQELTNLKSFVKNTAEVGQSITGECQTVLSFNKDGKPGEYRFFWGDIDEAAIKVRASGSFFELGLETNNRQKFIEVWKNGVRQNYASSLEIYADDIETFRFLPDILKQIILDCRSSPNALQTGNGQGISFINQKLGENAGVQQTVQLTDNCLLAVNRAALGGKNGGALKYELALSELNASSAEPGVSGSHVFVTVTTKDKQKTIKSFKSETPSDYVASIKLECADLATARQIKTSIDTLVMKCQNQHSVK